MNTKCADKKSAHFQTNTFTSDINNLFSTDCRKKTNWKFSDCQPVPTQNFCGKLSSQFVVIDSVVIDKPIL